MSVDRTNGTAIPIRYPAERGRVLRILARWERTIEEVGPAADPAPAGR
ncbi:MAG: hypothetical protein SFV24_10855 [Gemmatimonadales bacterium]|nr:hypothetical protein [Gemmatimonadales bacterium]MDX2058290.1 hypothetical protein [Gemmatimonadales bacterium]